MRRSVLSLRTQVSIVLVTVAQALQNLELHAWAVYVTSFLVYCIKHVAVSLLIIVVGFAIGNYVRDLMRARRGEGSEDMPAWIGEFVRYSILVFAFTMAVHQLNVAEGFVLITFSLLFGSLCLALALAFGLGAREVAGEIVRRRWTRTQADLRGGGAPPPSVPPVSAPKVSSSPVTPPTPGGDADGS